MHQHEYDDFALGLKDLRVPDGASGRTIRLEVYLCKKTPKGTHRIYQRVEALYEWRDNNGFVGVYLPLPADFSLKDSQKY